MISNIMTWLWIGVQDGLTYSLAPVGLYFCFIKHGFPDLTFDGSFALGGVVAATAIANGLNPWMATMLGAIAGSAAGCVTSVLYVTLGLNKLLCGIVVSIGTYSINLRIMNRSSISLLQLPTIYSRSILASPLAEWVWPILALVAVVTIMKLALRTMWGVAIQAVGDNEKRAVALGLPRLVLVGSALAVGNGIIGLAGGIVAQRQGFVAADMGVGAIIWGLAALLIGLPVGRKLKNYEFLSPAIGMVFYSICVALGLRLGLPATDLRLVTAIFVVAALYVTQIRRTGEGSSPLPKLSANENDRD